MTAGSRPSSDGLAAPAAEAPPEMPERRIRGSRVGDGNGAALHGVNGDRAATRALRIAMIHCSTYALDSRVQREARALAERGHEVHCVCLSPPQDIRVGRGLIRLHRVPGRDIEGGFRDYILGYGRFFAGALHRLTALEHRHRFDLVHAHNMPNFLVLAAALPKLRGAPVVLDMHDTFPELFETKFDVSYRHPLAWMVRREERLSAAFADQVIAVTEEARGRLAERCDGAVVEWVVMNSPDERVFGPPREPVTVPPAGPVRAVYHGGIARRFGVNSLIRAVAHLDESEADVQLDVYGSDEHNADLVAFAREIAPDRVRVAPQPIPFERIPDQLEGAHIGVVPTERDRFTELLLPVKLLEYVHLGIPVVASRLPVIEKYFSDEEVRYFEPGSPESLAAAIRDTCREPGAAMQRARRATERLREIAWSSQGQDFVSRLEALATVRAAAA